MLRKISIITPSLNRAHLLDSAVQSVANQHYPDCEHIIVDGGSTDGTEQIVHKYPGIRFVRDSDQGMYEALNKGLEIAAGEIIGFLNTDDLYAENIFAAVSGMFADPDVMAATGRAIVFSELSDGKIEVVDRYIPEDRSLLENLTTRGAFFNAWFFRRSTFDRIGRFNTSYKIVGDRDFMLRFALNELKYTVIDDLVYKYRRHEDSLTFDKSGQKREWSADEHLAMTRTYLAGQDLPGLARKLLIQLRTLETIDMAARSIWTRDYRKFIHYFVEGFRYNLAWPFAFFQYVLKRGVILLLTRRPVKRLS